MALPRIVLVTGCILTVAAVIVVYIAGRSFDSTFRHKVATLFGSQPNVEHKVITEEDIKDLPEPVQRYLRYTGVVGRARVAFVRLTQTGAMRPKPDGKWFPLKAEEYYSVDNPGFVWKGILTFAPLFSATAQDMYLNGRGEMHVKLLSAFTLVNASGKEMDEAALMRYFNEMQWFPTALVSDKVRWEAIDSGSARATLTDRGLSVSAVFCFDTEGKITNFIAERGRTTDDGKLVRTRWSTPIFGYRTYPNGLRLPSKGEAVWHLESGPYAYIRLEVTEVEYDTPALY